MRTIPWAPRTWTRVTAAAAALAGLAWVAPGCDGPGAAAAPTPAAAGAGRANPPAVRIIGPTEAPRIPTDALDGAGQPATVACSTCHTIKPPDRERREGTSLQRFHQGLTMQHGRLTCVSCHDPRDYDRLRLADGTPVPFTEVMTLCRQCHGPQARNYDHGAHGGMNGPWDPSKGPRTRNACTVCHDPHAPAFPRVQPAPPPADRGTVEMRRAHAERHHEAAAPAADAKEAKDHD